MPEAREFVPYHIDQTRLLERPALTAHLGLISVLWNRLEENVADLQSAILPLGAMGASGLLREMTRDLISLDIRADLARNLANVVLPKELTEELDELLKEVRARASERVKYVHSEWHLSDDIPDGIVRAPRRSEERVGKPARNTKFTRKRTSLT